MQVAKPKARRVSLDFMGCLGLGVSFVLGKMAVLPLTCLSPESMIFNFGLAEGRDGHKSLESEIPVW
jgi:hypothetical protein